MSNTFSQIHIQIVFAVKHRQSLIASEWEERLYQYISGTIRGMEQKMLAVNGVKDHIHLLIGMRPTACLSDIVREVKKRSTEMINANHLTKCHFQWQEGYGAFSYSKSCLPNVVNYISNQKEHHKIKTFKEEYTQLLKDFEISYKDEYLFDWME